MVKLKDIVFTDNQRNLIDPEIHRKKIYQKFALFLSLFGIIYTLTEFILLQFHTSICSSQGCKLVGHFAVFGENFVVAIGIIYFALLSISVFSHYKDNLLISLGLAVEGYLLGFQLFIIHTICYFCLGVFSIILIISFFYLLSSKYKITDYAYLIAILFIVYLIHPPYLNISSNGNYLFYSPTCPHCHQTMAYLRAHKISFKPVNANECQAFLNTFGINQVPCLVKKENSNNISIIVGEENIENYFTQMNQNINKINTVKNKKPIAVNLGSITVTAKRINNNSTANTYNTTNVVKPVNSTSSDSINGYLDYGSNKTSQTCTIGNTKCK